MVRSKSMYGFFEKRKENSLTLLEWEKMVPFALLWSKEQEHVWGNSVIVLIELKYKVESIGGSINSFHDFFPVFVFLFSEDIFFL